MRAMLQGKAAGISLVALALLAAPGASAQTCTITADTAIATSGGVALLDGPVADCGAGPVAVVPADAALAIDGGATVTVVGDLVQAGGVPTAGITVHAGATLRARVADASPTPGEPLVLVLGEAGLDCRPGSRCEFVGGFREWSAAPATRDEPQPWTLPAFVPCPDASGRPDCNGPAGRPDLARADFAPVASPAASAALSALAPGRDVLCFWDFDPTDASLPVDANYCYEVAAVDASAGAPSLDFDVRQGVFDQPGYPLARRLLVGSTLAGAVAAGERGACLDGTSATAEAALTADGMLVARWLRFADGTGAPRPRAHKILETRADDAQACGGAGFDFVRLGDVRGAPEAHAPGEPVWIDYGWQAGDPFFVMAPVWVASAAPAGHASTVYLDGQTDVYGAVFDGVGHVFVRGDGFERWQHVWARDLTGSISTEWDQILFDGVDGSVGHTAVSGGSGLSTCAPPGRPGTGSEPCDRLHTLSVEHGTVTFEDVAIRHGQDDHFWLSYGGHAHVRRARSAFGSDSMETGNFLAVYGSGNTFTVVDAICDDCVGSTTGGGLGVFQSIGTGSVENFLSWGNAGPFDGGSFSAVVPTRNVMIVGGGNEGVGRPLLPQRVQGFVLRDVESTYDHDDARAFDRASVDVRDGIVRDTGIALPAFARIPSGGILENVAIVNPRVAASADCSVEDCAVLESQGNPSAAEVARLTIAYTPGSAPENARYGFHLASRPYGALAIDGLLVTGFRGGSAAYALEAAYAGWIADVDWSGALCLFDNQADFRPELAPGFAGVSLVTGDPELADPAAGRFDPVPGGGADTAGCGIRGGVSAPGIREYLWFHAASGLAPEMMADDADGDGVPVDATVARCPAPFGGPCSDNCPAVFNPDQANANGSGAGDACPEACRDGVDNDGDGRTDLDDPGCESQYGESESPACDDGEDNDGDLLVDTDDPECPSASWKSEAAGPQPPGGGCGLGGEVALVLGLLLALRRAR